MISKLRNYKKEMAVFVLWFPFLFAINANLTDIYYLGIDLTTTINAIRIILFLLSFLILFFLFIINFKSIKLFNSIFFIYLLIFIIQSNFVFSENFGELIAGYKIYLNGNISHIIQHISFIYIGLEIQSIYMMIGSTGALIYFIIFNSKKYETTIKIQIIVTSLIIASVYLYFTMDMMIEYLTNEKTFMLYHSEFLNHSHFLGRDMVRSTGISRILVMISIIALLLLFRFKNNYLKIFLFIFIISINSVIILLASRFGIYSYVIIFVTLLLFIKISYFKKIFLIICLSIIPYLIQDTIKQYKFLVLINKAVAKNTLNVKDTVNNLNRYGQENVDKNLNEKSIVDENRDGQNNVDENRDGQNNVDKNLNEKSIVDKNLNEKSIVDENRDEKSIVDENRDEKSIVDGNRYGQNNVGIIHEINFLDLFTKNNDDGEANAYDMNLYDLYTKNNDDYEKKKKYYIELNGIVTNRNLITLDKDNNSLKIETTGRLSIWKKAYSLILDGKVNILIGNGYQTDRKLLTFDDNSMFYGSNVSSSLLHIFMCSGLIGLFIFLYINLKVMIRIFHFYFIEKIYLNYNSNFTLIVAINTLLLLYLRSLVENSIAYYNIDFLIFLMCLYIIDKKRKII